MSRNTSRRAQRSFGMETLEDRKMFCGIQPQIDMGVSPEVDASAAQTYFVKAQNNGLQKFDSADTEADFGAASAPTDKLIKGGTNTPHKMNTTSGPTGNLLQLGSATLSTEVDGAMSPANVDAVMQDPFSVT